MNTLKLYIGCFQRHHFMSFFCCCTKSKGAISLQDLHGRTFVQTLCCKRYVMNCPQFHCVNAHLTTV